MSLLNGSDLTDLGAQFFRQSVALPEPQSLEIGLNWSAERIELSRGNEKKSRVPQASFNVLVQEVEQ